MSRAARLVKLGAGLTGGYLADQLQRPFLSAGERVTRRQARRAESARKVRGELQELRGPVMKLGQAMSMQTHLLGPEWIEELSGLQMQAPAMHPSLMRAQFKSSMGKYPEEVFASFEAEPFAAASLGQVHWAVTRDGEEVAVKIQYPAIREAIESDFRLLMAAGAPARLTGHLQRSVIEEARRGILEETDYRREAANMEHFRKSLAPLEFIRVPRALPSLSSDQVLTMSRLRGLRLLDFLKTNPAQHVRDRLGAALTRLFFFQLFRMNALHADPHPGNYLFAGDGAIGIVDFGCVKHLKPEVVRCYAQFWSREWMRDSAQYAELVRTVFGRKTAEKDPRARRALDEIRRFYDEFHPLTEPPVTLDLGDSKFAAGLTELARVILSNRMLSPDFLFLSRTESGLCNILHSLKARVATTQIVREFITAPFKPT